MILVYLLQFHYPEDRTQGLFSRRGGGGALNAAYKAVEQEAAKVGVTLRHEYAWPDGSLYLYAWGGDLEALSTALEEANKLVELRRAQLHVVEALAQVLSEKDTPK